MAHAASFTSSDPCTWVGSSGWCWIWSRASIATASARVWCAWTRRARGPGGSRGSACPSTASPGRATACSGASGGSPDTCARSAPTSCMRTTSRRTSRAGSLPFWLACLSWSARSTAATPRRVFWPAPRAGSPAACHRISSGCRRTAPRCGTKWSARAGAKSWSSRTASI